MVHSELLKRSITGFVLAVLGIVIIYFSSYPFVINSGVLFLCLCSVYELYRAANFKKEYIILFFFWLLSACACYLPIPFYLNFLIVLYPFVIAFFLVMMILRERFCKFERRRALIFPAFIVIFLFHSMIAIRQLENGIYYLCFGIICCCLTDIFAYVFGKTLGKHKLCPQISPKKTWEGSIGGTLSSIIILVALAFLIKKFVDVDFNYVLIVVYTLLISVFSQFGDLSMSVVKRICGIKDYGKIFPGHGGVLDRFDSQLIAIPLAYILCGLKGFVL